MKNLKLLLIISSLSIGFAANSTFALPINVTYENIFPTNGASETSIDPYVGYFTTQVADAGSGKVRITFTNNSDVGAIGDVYIEDLNGLLTFDGLNVANVTVNGVEFKDIKNPTLSQGNKVNFNEAFGYQFTMGGSNRINKGETLGIEFTGDQAGIEAALTTDSASPASAPDTGATIALLGSALLGLGILKKRK